MQAIASKDVNSLPNLNTKENENKTKGKKNKKRESVTEAISTARTQVAKCKNIVSDFQVSENKKAEDKDTPPPTTTTNVNTSRTNFTAPTTTSINSSVSITSTTPSTSEFMSSFVPPGFSNQPSGGTSSSSSGTSGPSSMRVENETPNAVLQPQTGRSAQADHGFRANSMAAEIFTPGANVLNQPPDIGTSRTSSIAPRQAEDRVRPAASTFRLSATAAEYVSPAINSNTVTSIAPPRTEGLIQPATGFGANPMAAVPAPNVTIHVQSSSTNANRTPNVTTSQVRSAVQQANPSEKLVSELGLDLTQFKGKQSTTNMTGSINPQQSPSHSGKKEEKGRTK
jgi:hypothetical protein